MSNMASEEEGHVTKLFDVAIAALRMESKRIWSHCGQYIDGTAGLRLFQEFWGREKAYNHLRMANFMKEIKRYTLIRLEQ